MKQPRFACFTDGWFFFFPPFPYCMRSRRKFECVGEAPNHPFHLFPTSCSHPKNPSLQRWPLSADQTDVVPCDLSTRAFFLGPFVASGGSKALTLCARFQTKTCPSNRR